MIPQGLLPPDMIDRACIAGGYAACPSLASDMDVWIYRSADPAEDKNKVIAHLVSRRLLDLKPAMKLAIESNEAMITRLNRYDHPNYVLCVGEVHIEGRQPKIHVMVIDAPDIPTLLEGFDISTHAVAIDHLGAVIKGEKWSPITKPVVAYRRNANTLARVKKIEERYQPWRNAHHGQTPLRRRLLSAWRRVCCLTSGRHTDGSRCTCGASRVRATA